MKRQVIRYAKKYKRHIRIAGLSVGIIILCQLLYPRSLARPLSWLSGDFVGLRSRSSIEKGLRKTDTSIITYRIDDVSRQFQLAESGIAIDAVPTAVKVVDYPLLQRFIPLSFFFKHDTPLPVTSIDEQKYNLLVEKIYQESTVVPQNALAHKTSAVDFEKVAGSNGKLLKKEHIEQSLRNFPLQKYDTVVYKREDVTPEVSDQDIDQLIEKLKSIQPLQVTLDGKSYEASNEDIRSWANIATNENNTEALIMYDHALIDAWIASKPATQNDGGQPTIITVHDGNETSRQEGRAGRTIDTTALKESMINALQSGQTQVSAELKQQPIATRHVRTYSATSVGINLLMNDWQKEFNIEASVSLRGAISADLEPVKSYFAASLYKLFIASYVLNGISKGQINGDEIVQGGRSYRKCVEDMIVRSDNPCPETLMQKIGGSTLTNYARSLGFGSSSVGSGSSSTTSGDMALYMQKLVGGQLLNSTDSQTLLGYMSRQIYRQAIPAGSGGASVADKVGFYGAVWHDVAYVRAPNGPYTLAVLTKGGSPNPIKVLAERIFDTLN